MDRQLGAFSGHQHDDLKEVARPIRADDEPAIGVLTGVTVKQGMVDGVEDIRVGHAMLARRAVHIHKANRST